jgi:UDP-glucose 4-epimerase
VQKAPAATIADLATALQQLLKTNLPVKIIGTRHGEKLYESLVSREEMAIAEDREGYYRIAADTRDLNYDKYFTQGEVAVSENEDYTSHNTQRLDVEGVKKTLLPLDLIQKAMHA